jgi:cation diffusion facilitator CzcD-associated flavoprotein CzcO
MTVHARMLDVLVIGAGQAGLALGFHLKKTPFRFEFVERHERVGARGTPRWSSSPPTPTVRSQALRCPVILMDTLPKTRWPTI